MDVINIYYFNPLAPHGARRRAGDTAGAGGVKISIHSPRTGRDLPARRLPRMLTVFQSTRPARGETAGGDAALGSQHISIHSPRTGRDLIHAMSTYPSTDFNPLAPHGARLATEMPSRWTSLYFNPLAPHGARRRSRISLFSRCNISIHSPRTGRDVETRVARLETVISIHSPRTGRDASSSTTLSPERYFNPLAPHGARHHKKRWIHPLYKISIHSPRTGRDKLSIFCST